MFAINIIVTYTDISFLTIILSHFNFNILQFICTFWKSIKRKKSSFQVELQNIFPFVMFYLSIIFNFMLIENIAACLLCCLLFHVHGKLRIIDFEVYPHLFSFPFSSFGCHRPNRRLFIFETSLIAAVKKTNKLRHFVHSNFDFSLIYQCKGA